MKIRKLQRSETTFNYIFNDQGQTVERIVGPKWGKPFVDEASGSKDGVEYHCGTYEQIAMAWIKLEQKKYED